MNILGLQETDWLTRGPHTQHHVFERLSKKQAIRVTVFDYDIDKQMRVGSLVIKKKIYTKTSRAIKDSKIILIRSGHLQVPYLRRISSLIANFFDILKFIRKSRPDIIISLSITNGLIGLILAKIFNIPFLFYYIDKLHTLVPIKPARQFARTFSKVLLKCSDRIIVVTKLLRNYVIHEGANPEKIDILLNGISLKNTKVDTARLERLKKQFTISDDDFVICFMGYLYDFAGLKEIITYYNDMVSNRDLNMKFLIIGDGGIYSDLKNYIEQINAKWVILTGKVPYFELANYLQLADLCLLSFALNDITREITPVKVMEYMAMKKPVLSNSLPGVVAEIDKNNGVIFASNQKDLIIKIKDLSKNKTELKDLGQKGYKLIKKYYVWPKILNQLKQIILEMIKEKKITRSF